MQFLQALWRDYVAPQSRQCASSAVIHGTSVYGVQGNPQDVLMGLRPSISSNTPPHFGHLMMCDARRISSFG